MFDVIGWDEISRVLPTLDLVGAIEEGFAAYSQGNAHVAPVSELRIPRGELHIKSGYISGDSSFVIKVASGFYGNPAKGLPSSNGLMLLFDSQTGVPMCLLLDEGRLTDIRTAIAGFIAAKFLAPNPISAIGIIGTGTQARLQAQYLLRAKRANRLFVYGRNAGAVSEYQRDMAREAVEVVACDTAAAVAANANLIVTTTPSTSPLLNLEDIAPGTHITAVGADSPEKNELDPAILHNANRIVVDSLQQCSAHGELKHALAAGSIPPERIVELGDVIAARKQGRIAGTDITVADLTGVAVQDIEIARAVFAAVKAVRT